MVTRDISPKECKGIISWFDGFKSSGLQIIKVTKELHTYLHFYFFTHTCIFTSKILLSRCKTTRCYCQAFKQGKTCVYCVCAWEGVKYKLLLSSSITTLLMTSFPSKQTCHVHHSPPCSTNICMISVVPWPWCDYMWYEPAFLLQTLIKHSFLGLPPCHSPASFKLPKFLLTCTIWYTIQLRERTNMDQDRHNKMYASLLGAKTDKLQQNKYHSNRWCIPSLTPIPTYVPMCHTHLGPACLLCVMWPLGLYTCNLLTFRPSSSSTKIFTIQDLSNNYYLHKLFRLK